MDKTQPDTKTGPYYVTAKNASGCHLMAGPYALHEDALADVNRSRDIAYARDRRAWFMTWGTTRIEGADHIGTLNKRGLI